MWRVLGLIGWLIVLTLTHQVELEAFFEVALLQLADMQVVEVDHRRHLHDTATSDQQQQQKHDTAYSNQQSATTAKASRPTRR